MVAKERARRRARAETSGNGRGGPVLEVRSLKTQFNTQDGVVKAVDDVSFYVMPGETLGVVGESGCGKSMTGLSIMRLIPSPPGKIVAGEIIFNGDDILQHDRRTGPRDSRQRHRDDLPGPDDVAESGADHQSADQRSAPAAHGHEQGAGARAHDRTAQDGRHPECRGAGRSVSAPVLRRYAPARDDRHGAVVQSEAADRRRADDRAGRDDPGADSRPDAHAATGARHRRDPRHPLDGRGGRHGRSHPGHVRRATSSRRRRPKRSSPIRATHTRSVCSSRSRASTPPARKSSSRSAACRPT